MPSYSSQQMPSCFSELLDELLQAPSYEEILRLRSRIGLPPAPSYEEFMLLFRLYIKTRVQQPAPSRPPPPPRSTLVISTYTTAGNVSWRLSAFANDKRITNNRELVKGSYVTTDADIEVVGSGFAAVGRYALPNPFPSVYAYAGEATGHPTRLGTVRPNFGPIGRRCRGSIRCSQWVLHSLKSPASSSRVVIRSEVCTYRLTIALEPTPNSFRSYVAPTIGRGSPRALGVAEQTMSGRRRAVLK